MKNQKTPYLYINEFVNKLILENKSKNTVECYKNELRHFFKYSNGKYSTVLFEDYVKKLVNEKRYLLS